MVGDKIGNYQIIRKIGEGGMGAVYEAVNEQIGRHVAIKVLHPEHTANPEILARFFNEARAVNVVSHPSLVDVYEIGQLPGGSAYIIMQYLKGESLGDLMARARLDRARGLRFIRQIASAMAVAHERGIIHRDLKPNNVIIVADPESVGGERVKVLDFGIAKVVNPEHDPQGVMKTRVGVILGTPAYMSPEQCRGAAGVTDRADVYSLGVMLFEVLAGRVPFMSDSAMELLGMHMHVPPPRLDQLDPSLPPPLVALVHQMLAKLPDERPSMRQVAERLEALTPSSRSAQIQNHSGRTVALTEPASDAPPRRSRLPLILGLVVGLVIAGGAAGLFGVFAPKTEPRTSSSQLASPPRPDTPRPMEPAPDLRAQEEATPDLRAQEEATPDLAAPAKPARPERRPPRKRPAADITDESLRVVP